MAKFVKFIDILCKMLRRMNIEYTDQTDQHYVILITRLCPRIYLIHLLFKKKIAEKLQRTNIKY